MLPYACSALALLYAWWAAPLVFFVASILQTFAARLPFVPQQLEWYVMRFIEHAARREADFVKTGDGLRADAARELVTDLQGLFALYTGSGTLAPSMSQAQSAAYGNARSLLGQQRAATES